VVSNLRKTISLVLALVLVVTVFPLQAFAETPATSNVVNFDDFDKVKGQFIETIKDSAEKLMLHWTLLTLVADLL